MTRSLTFPIVLVLLLVTGTSAVAGPPERFAIQTDVDHVWTMTAAALVFMMQAGFLLLEAGSVRSKNSVNVAQKNLFDFLISVSAFGVVGFMLMFGASQGGVFGFDIGLVFFGMDERWSMTFFVFQMMFCGTAATIVSGAVAERMSMGGYIVCTSAIALVIYPIAGHWVWGGALTGDAPLLAAWGLIDFAGGAVVHVLGAAVGLAAIILIGPREGKFDAQGRPCQINGHSPVLSTAGCLILWVGWIGFNGGSTVAGTDAFAHIVLNTMIAGATGGLSMALIGKVGRGVFKPEFSINGALGGLVAITPACDAVTTQGAMLIGLGAGAVVYLSAHAIEHRFKLDDPLQAVSVHGTAGAFGMVMTGVLARPDALMAGGRLAQIGVQVAGTAIIFLWAFGMATLILRVAARMLPAGPVGGRRFRIDAEAERVGLNASEHDAPMGTGILTEMMAEVVRNPEAEIKPLELEVGDEAHEMSVLFNRIVANIQAVQAAERARQAAERDVAEAELLRHQETQNEVAAVIDSCAAGDFSRRVPTEGRSGFHLDIARQVNGLCETFDHGLDDIAQVLGRLAKGDLTARMGDDCAGRFAEIRDDMHGAMAALADVVAGIAAASDDVARGAMVSQETSERLLAQSRTQADRVARTVGALGEMATMARDATTQGEEALRCTEAALQEATAGRSVTKKVVRYMGEMDAVTADITAAIDQIGEIAFLTHLLSLNASVQAAHGGVNSGFDVVADEVRILAGKTAEAVANIQGKSRQLGETVERGRATVGRARDSLGRIVDAASQAAGVARDVSQTGLRQAERVDQVREAVVKVDRHAREGLELADTTRRMAGDLAGNVAATRAHLSRFQSQDPEGLPSAA